MSPRKDLDLTCSLKHRLRCHAWPPVVLSLVCLLALVGERICGQETSLPLIAPTAELPEAVDAGELRRIVASVDRGLQALQSLQQPDGSFATSPIGQPGVTSLGIMAYLSRGHVPGEGPYGETLDKAINYVLSQQKPSGILSHTEIDFSSINVQPTMGPEFTRMVTKSYNHAISMLMLSEVYGLTGSKDAYRIKESLEKGLKFTIQLWDIRPASQIDDGGFRYTQPALNQYDADVSITAWHAASLRSLRNAGFDIPGTVMNRIAAYVIRVQRSDGSIAYLPDRSSTPCMTAAGTLCLLLAGKHEHESVLKAAGYLSGRTPGRNTISQHPIDPTKPYYDCYYRTQAAIQLGGRLWVEQFKLCSIYLLRLQRANGLWASEGYGSSYGSAYSTSMAVLSLTPTLQLLPLYQR